MTAKRILKAFAILSILPVTGVAGAAPERSKEIRFEDELVEGLNRRPLDSLQQVREDPGGQTQRLYRKRSGFQDRNEALLWELQWEGRRNTR
jgi:hypothetical protein